MQSQSLIAESLKRKGLFPWATDAGAGRTGKDILNTPSFAIEVKARSNFEPVSSMRQAKANADDTETPIVVCRMNGQGPANIGQWIAFTTWDEMTMLMAFKQAVLRHPEIWQEMNEQYGLQNGDDAS